MNIGKLSEKIKVSVVDADIPLLLGLDYQTKWGMVMDIGRKKNFIRKSNEKFKMNDSSSHWMLPIQSDTLHTQGKHLVLNVNWLKMKDNQLRIHVQKVHKNLSHKSEEQLMKLFQMAGELTTRVRKTIKHVVETCQICRRFKKTPPRPRVAMPKANTVNEVVSMDLKERRDFKKQILYICDEFSGYMVAEVINNKLPETVIKAFNKRWVREGPGIPSKGLFADNGGEFKNPEMKEMATKYGLSLRLTAAYSPWSNGKNERNHYTCDVIIDKLMEEDPKLSLEDAVSHAVDSKNMQITRKGFSPRQLMFGQQGVVPGITEGNPASMEPVTESDSFRREFITRQKAQEMYRKVDANERLQKTLAQNTQGYSDHVYGEGEMVFFKEDGKNMWSGPGQVTGMEGSKVRLVHAGYDRTVPACRVIPFQDQKYLEKNEGSKTNENEEYGETNSEYEPCQMSAEQGEPESNSTVDSITEDEVTNIDVRPKLHSKIAYKVSGDTNWRFGKVSSVGKKDGKHKFRCWIKTRDTEENFDFVKDVSSWKYCQIDFSNDAKTEDKRSTATTEPLSTGVWYLQNKNILNKVIEDAVVTSEVFVTNIPLKYHNEPDIIEAKRKELEKWDTYEAYVEVDRHDNYVLGSRWIVQEKNGKPKARFVVKGCHEKLNPRSDSPTASKDSLKLFLALAANEDFELKSLDVTSAFLQGRPLEREVYIEPPLEKANPGKVWKLKKGCYGLYDASRQWYMAVREALVSANMTSVSGDDAMFFC